MMLSARNVCWAAGCAEILHDVSLDVVKGEFLGIIGPNGSGKTTLLSLLSGIRRPRSGTVLLGNAPIQKFNRREIARRLALVEQQAETTERITARQAVELGRTPYLGRFRPGRRLTMRLLGRRLRTSIWRIWPGAAGIRFRAASASGSISPAHLHRSRKSCFWTNQPTILISATRSGFSISSAVRGLTVVAALHDLNHAAMFCDRIAVMDTGQLVALGSPREVLSAESIRAVFGVEVDVEYHGVRGCHIRYRLPDRPSLELRCLA